MCGQFLLSASFLLTRINLDHLVRLEELLPPTLVHMPPFQNCVLGQIAGELFLGFEE